MDDACSALKKCGVPCTYRAKYDDDEGRRVCGVHKPRNVPPPPPPAVVTNLETCCICLANIASKKSCKSLKKCGHTFHGACIATWFRQGGVMTCPMCRAPCIEELSTRTRALSRKMSVLLRTVPSPHGGFFPAHIIALLESPDVVEALAISDDTRQLLVEIAYQTFTETNFFSMMRHLRL